ncbi:MAG: thioredoxin [Phycisphaerae bacterium]
MTSAKVVQLDERNFDTSITHGVTVVDFWAPWCGPCRMLGPVLDDLALKLDGKATVAKVNVDESPAIALRYGVSAIPLIVVLKDGREVDRLVGLQNLPSLMQAVAKAQ